MPEELRPAPGEGLYSRLIIPKAVEVLRAAVVGEDVEEAQELAVDATGGAQHARQEGVGDTRPRGVGHPVATQLCPRRRLEELVWLGAPLRLISAMWLPPPNPWMNARPITRLASPPMLAVLVDDVTGASADSPLLPERSKRRDRNPKELTEPDHGR